MRAGLTPPPCQWHEHGGSYRKENSREVGNLESY